MTAKIIGMAHVHDVERWTLDPDGRPLAVPDLEFELRADFNEGPFAHLWIEGDSYIKTMWRKNSKPQRTREAVEAHRHDGQLWERELERDENSQLYVKDDWLVFDSNGQWGGQEPVRDLRDYPSRQQP